ncbi:MAG: sulfite exporter TauE/SafE family protein [Planctomycetaceae bacterium]
MLGSITPLGERGRGSRWVLTATAYLVGSVLGGLVVGAAAGLVGALTVGALDVPAAARLAVLGVAVLGGFALDLRLFGLRLPTNHRQVDEEWRSRYRGWVWGLGFGVQLGLGVVTIVTTSTVYATVLGAALTGSVTGGVVVGAVFGLARALPVFAVARVRRPDQLLHVDGTLRRLAGPARRATYVAGGTLAATALALAGSVRW